MKWKLGDKVILKSGGPVMEVIGFSRNGNVWCEYTDREGFLNEESFPPPCLMFAPSLVTP
jgi:uncharacterized protein YodC (DUF2158 family)